MTSNTLPPPALALALADAAADFVASNPRSRELHVEATGYLPGGNTRSSLWVEPFPLCMVRGHGSRVVDADGHQYIDFLGEFTAGIYGHSPQAVQQTLVETLQAGMNLSSHNPWEGKLAKLICSRFPSIQLLRFTNSGTEANLMALTAARAATGRRRVLVFEGAYHGSLLSFAAGGSHPAPEDGFVVGRYNDTEGAVALIDAHRAELAAILVEPMLGAGGCIPGDSAFLGALRDAASSVGAMLIFDEIQTSRLSVAGRQGLLGITPDLTTLGKFYGGGLAFGCFGGRRDIMELFDPRRPRALSHAGTFNNNTLAMAAGLAAVSALTETALGRLNGQGEALRKTLLELFRSARLPFTVTGLGSLMTIHATRDGVGGDGLRKLLYLDLLTEGIFMASRGLIALSMAITDEEIGSLCRALEKFSTHRRDCL